MDLNCLIWLYKRSLHSTFFPLAVLCSLQFAPRGAHPQLEQISVVAVILKELHLMSRAAETGFLQLQHKKPMGKLLSKEEICQEHPTHPHSRRFTLHCASLYLLKGDLQYIDIN